MEETLERLRLVELLEDAAPLLVGERGRGHFGVLLDPRLLVRLLDVHVLDADRSAIRVAQQTEDGGELHAGPAAEATRGELAVEVPQRQAVGEGVELGVDHRRVLAQWVQVGDEVAPYPVHVDELEDPGLLLGPRPRARRRVGVHRPPRRDVGDLHRLEDLVVEAVLAEEELMDAGEEQARFGSLDDPVVVRGRHRQRPPDPGHRDRLRVGALVLGGEADAADPDDHALADHETRHGLNGADGAGVGQRHGRPGEVVRPDRSGAGAAHDVLVCLPVLTERHRVDGLDVRHEQRS